MKINNFLRLIYFCQLLIICLSLLQPAVFAGEAQPAELPSQLRKITENPFVIQGDTRGEINYWLELALEAPDSPGSELVFRLINNIAPIDLPPTGAFEKSLEKYLASNPGNGCAADAARRLLANWYKKRGAFASARKLEAEGAVLMDWLVAGPFGHNAHANFDTAYPPEEGIESLHKSFPGSRERVNWRAIQPDPFANVVNPYKAIHPSVGTALYLMTQLKLNVAQQLFLQVDCPASWKLWINGRLVKTVNRIEAYLPRETFVLIPRTDPGGWEQVIFKIYSPSGDTELRVRLTDAEGASLPATAYEIDNSIFHQPHNLDPQPDLNKSVASPGWFLPSLERTAGEFTEDPSVHAALAMAYRLQGIPDQARAQALLALEKDGGTVYSHLLAAEMEVASFHLPQNHRANSSRQHYSAALALEPSCIPASIALVQSEDKDGRPQVALDRLDKLLQSNPECITALRLRTQLALDLDWDEEAERWTNDYAKIAPGSLGVALLQARTALNFQRMREVAEAYEVAREADQSELLLWLAHLKALGRIGDRDKANEVADKLSAIAPNSVTVLERLTQHYLRFDEFEKALKAISRACEILPSNEQLWRLKGDILVRADFDLKASVSKDEKKSAFSGQENSKEINQNLSAIAAYRQSLKLSPSQHDLRRLISRLHSGSASTGVGGIGNTGIPERAFWSNNAIDPAEMLRLSGQQEIFGNTVRLIDQTVIQLYPDGSREESTHQLHKVLTESGIPLARQVPIFGEILEARTILPYGQTLEPTLLSAENTLTMPQLRPGAAVEYRFLTSTKARHDFGFHGQAFYFRSPDLEEKFMLSQYIIHVPNELPFIHLSRNGAPPARINRGKEETTYSWTMTNTARVWHEPNMPHIKEFLPYVEFGSKKSWDEVAGILRNAYLGRLQPTVEMRELLLQLVGGEDDPRRRTEILYRYVMDNIEESNMPGGASIILARQSGERLPLLMALLQMADIEVRFAALRPNREILFDANWEMPMAEYFHAYALAVFFPNDEDPLWLDTRFRALAPGQIVEDFNGASAFVLGSEGGNFMTLPQLAPESFGTDETIKIELDQNSLSGIATGTRIIRGASAADFKEILPGASRRDRIRILERRLGRSFPLVTASELSMPGLSEPGVPYREDYQVKVDRLLRRGKGGQLSMPLCFAPLMLVEDLDNNPLRRHNPYRLSQYLIGTEEVSIAIPAGYRVAELPESVTTKDFFGSYSFNFHSEDSTLRMTRRYVFTPRLVPKGDYPRLVEMARLIHNLEKAQIVFLPLETETAGQTQAKAQTQDE